jgi:hypothetical protein
MDQISSELDLEPLVPYNPFETKVTIVNHQDADKNLDEDFMRSRDALANILENGTKMLPDLARLAQQSESARMFEVLATYMNTLQTASMNMVDIHKKRKEAVSSVQPTESTQKKFAYVGAIEDIEYD